jgi:Peptidase inhibitor family I36
LVDIGSGLDQTERTVAHLCGTAVKWTVRRKEKIMSTLKTHNRQSTMRRRLTGLVLAAAGTLAMGAAIAPQAQAAAGAAIASPVEDAGGKAITPQEAAKPGPCANRLCLFEDSHRRGIYVAYAVGSSDMSRFGPFFDKMTSSMLNNTGKYWCLYKETGWDGRTALLVRPHVVVPTLPNGWDEKIRSARPLPPTGCFS